MSALSADRVGVGVGVGGRKRGRDPIHWPEKTGSLYSFFVKFGTWSHSYFPFCLHGIIVHNDTKEVEIDSYATISFSHMQLHCMQKHKKTKGKEV